MSRRALDAFARALVVHAQRLAPRLCGEEAADLACMGALAARLSAAQPEPSGLCAWLREVEGPGERAAVRAQEAGAADPLFHWLCSAPLPPGLGAQPLVELYERYLRARAPSERKARGMYFTPAALCEHVVRRVDELLTRELSVPLGLADCSSFEQLGLRAATPGAKAVRILDPAAGAGAFLSAVIARVAFRMEQRFAAQGLDGAARREAWRRYVPVGLLPRLHGIELSARTRGVCQLQLRLALEATGYRLGASDALALTRADALLELPPHVEGAASGGDALARCARATVIVGNPPYARGRAKDHALWSRWLAPYKAGLAGERNLQPLADDYVRFVRLSERVLSDQPLAVAALVTSSSLLDGALFRGMRASLGASFPRIDVLDLGGSVKRGARVPGGPRDENLFDVAQGVSVLWLRRGPSAEVPVLRHARLRGLRRDKLAQLRGPAIPLQELPLCQPERRFVPEADVPGDYATFAALDQLFATRAIGAKSGADGRLVSFDRTQAAPLPYAYRPLDTRHVDAALRGFTRPSPQARALVTGQRLLLATRFAQDGPFAHAFVTRLLPDVIFLSNKTSVNCFAFPETALTASACARLCDAEVSPGQAFEYVYAVLWSPAYRARYAPALARGFARIPPCPDRARFLAVAALGRRLCELHLLETDLRALRTARFDDGGDRSLSRALSRVRGPAADASLPINATSRFVGLSQPSWDFRVGGYPLCRKWLLDRQRAGRPLGDSDVDHYLDLVTVVQATLALMPRIDEARGG